MFFCELECIFNVNFSQPTFAVFNWMDANKKFTLKTDCSNPTKPKSMKEIGS